MKAINKVAESKRFSDWKKKNAKNVEWKKFTDPKFLHRSEYIFLKSQLIAQQENLCCYCEVALKNTVDAHIEHLKAQSDFPKLIYEFQNLLASCQFTDCCGHKKGNKTSVGLISPLDPNCERQFTYTGTGKIIPAEKTDQTAQDTIDLLGLNCKRLQDRRKTIIKILATSDPMYLKQALDSCFAWHDGFYTVIAYLIDKSRGLN